MNWWVIQVFKYLFVVLSTDLVIKSRYELDRTHES